MKRDEALRALSRDHHRALSAAQRLGRAEDPIAARAEFLSFWREHGIGHFRVEEEVMLPVWSMHGELDPESVSRMLDEHLRIRRGTLLLERSEPTLDQLRSLGEDLAAHVRFEERELFPLIERSLDEAALGELAAAIERAES